MFVDQLFVFLDFPHGPRNMTFQLRQGRRMTSGGGGCRRRRRSSGGCGRCRGRQRAPPWRKKSIGNGRLAVAAAVGRWWWWLQVSLLFGLFQNLFMNSKEFGPYTLPQRGTEKSTLTQGQTSQDPQIHGSDVIVVVMLLWSVPLFGGLTMVLFGWTTATL